jgi:hypothetical protein
VRKAIIGLAVTAALLAGCGGDDSSISKQEYDQQLEVVCNKGLQEREELTTKLGQEAEEGKKKKGIGDVAEVIKQLIGIYKGTTEEIADIGLPEGTEKEAEALVQGREEAAEQVEADPLGSVSINSPAFDNAVKAAANLDAKSCGM